MQPADDVQFRDAESQCLPRFLNNLLDRQLKTIGVPLLPGEGAKLAAQDAVVRIVDIAIKNVACPISHFASPGNVCNSSNRIQILALEEPQGIHIGNALIGGHFLVYVPKAAALYKKL